MSISDVLAWLTVGVAMPGNWWLAYELRRYHKAKPHLRVLRAVWIMIAWVAAVVAIFGLVFLNNGMEHPILDVEQTRILTRTAILSLSIPAIYFLRIIRRTVRKP